MMKPYVNPCRNKWFLSVKLIYFQLYFAVFVFRLTVNKTSHKMSIQILMTANFSNYTFLFKNQVNFNKVQCCYFLKVFNLKIFLFSS